MESRFRKVMSKVAEGWKAGAAPEAAGGAKEGSEERFVMKPGEVTILRGGGAKIVREPGEPRDAG